MNQPEVQDITIRQIDNVADLEVLYPIFLDSFPDPKEQLPLESFKEWFVERDAADLHSLFYLIYAAETPIGFRILIYSEKLQIGYVPYGGLLQKYRGHGIYPAISEQMTSQLIAHKIEIVVNECENPLKLSGAAQLAAQKRLSTFINKLNYKFVAEDKLPYVRNAVPIHSDDELKQTWDHYLLGFSLLVNNTDVITPLPDKISKADYKKLYLAIRYFERDIDDETELRKIPAVNLFLSRLESYPEEYIELIY